MLCSQWNEQPLTIIIIARDNLITITTIDIAVQCDDLITGITIIIAKCNNLSKTRLLMNSSREVVEETESVMQLEIFRFIMIVDH